MPPKPNPDRFAQAQDVARADEEATKPAPEQEAPRKARKRPEGTPAQQATRKPNADYEREGRLFAMLPQALCDQLDVAVIMERRKRPKPFDKSMAVEEALRDWLKTHKH